MKCIQAVQIQPAKLPFYFVILYKINYIMRYLLHFWGKIYKNEPHFTFHALITAKQSGVTPSVSPCTSCHCWCGDSRNDIRDASGNYRFSGRRRHLRDSL